ncbi:MAG: 50S ribosomal protein L11 methyltransferase [Desulfobacteraceae bacterium]|nr:50S ribosomal protein L11 methyltransferase [Desulfobacteraceae bacterium]
MKWLEVKITYEAEDPALAADLIADIFYGLGSGGVVVDDPDLETSEKWDADCVPLPKKPAVTAYLPADDRIGQSCMTINNHLSRMAVAGTVTGSINYRQVNEEDWAESWKAFFHPKKISDTFVIKPTWHDYTPKAGEQIIELDPGMAFGAGTHQSTILCVRMLENYLNPGQSVLDVGTGSGILLVAASKLGACQLTGVDVDPSAVAIARENLLLNSVDETVFDVKCGDLVNDLTGQYDLVVANILADVICNLLDDLDKVLKPGGLFIGSGIIENARSEVLKKLEHKGYGLIETLTDQEWVAIAARRGV